MRLIDEQYRLRPYYGAYLMWQWLSKGYKINLKRLRRRYRLMWKSSVFTLYLKRANSPIHAEPKQQ